MNKNILSKACLLICKELLDSMETLPDQHDKEVSAAMDSQADEHWKRMLEMWWRWLEHHPIQSQNVHGRSSVINMMMKSFAL